MTNPQELMIPGIQKRRHLDCLLPSHYAGRPIPGRQFGTMSLWDRGKVVRGKLPVRIGIPTALTAMLVAGTAGTAVAGNTQVVLYDRSNDLAASMLHLDPDPDKVYIKDSKSDGHGVRGTLQILETGTWRNLKSKYNGDPAPSYAVMFRDIIDGYTYRMRICTVDGASDTTPVQCAYKKFEE
ncbi:hypothetical protein [Streptomyces sp. NPDC059009]|uniref:hypothetical protein n=1 Tax=Streptomyces sp. NPDC059009 TaxID=3346694 RepID=UPI0036AC3CD4